MVILVAKPVPNSTNITPRKARTKNFGLIAEPDGSFANHR